MVRNDVSYGMLRCLMVRNDVSYGMWRCVFGRVFQDVSKERTAFIPKVLYTKRNLERKTMTLLGVNICVPFGYADRSYI